LPGYSPTIIVANLLFSARFDEFGAIYEDMAEEIGALEIAQVMEGILADHQLKSDEIHPNGVGYRVMAERIAAKVKARLGAADRLRGRSSFS